MASSLFHDLGDLLACPESGRRLKIAEDAWSVEETGRRYPVTDGIPNLFVPNSGAPAGTDVTELVKQFYEETPFPNYDEIDSRDSLEAKAKRSLFAAMLDSEIPTDAVVLEAGCGTGQMTNFLGMSWKHRVVGGDICLNSLRLAERFRVNNSIRNAAFLQMNLFRPPFRDQSFDVVVTNGVLHHTADPEGGFAALLSKLKPGGVICVGLYNSYARLPTLWRRKLFEMFPGRFMFLDPLLRGRRENIARYRAWFMDQYKHPHESKHSMDEVLAWFDRHGVEFLSGMPPFDGSAFSADDRFLERHSRGSKASRAAAQIGMLVSGSYEGGLFIVIGRKRR